MDDQDQEEVDLIISNGHKTNAKEHRHGPSITNVNMDSHRRVVPTIQGQTPQSTLPSATELAKNFPRTGKLRNPAPPSIPRASQRTAAKRRKLDDSDDQKKGGIKGQKNKEVVEKIRDWRPIDDVILISGLQQVPDLEALHQMAQFSQKYTLTEVQERWTALLYDEKISDVARKNIAEIYLQGDLFAINRIPFSEREETLIVACGAKVVPSLASFEKLLETNRNAFHPTRRPKDLLRHLNLMNFFGYTPKTHKKKSTTPLRASDVVSDIKLDGTRDLAMPEINRMDRKLKKRIREVESTISTWDEASDEKADVRRAAMAAKEGRRQSSGLVATFKDVNKEGAGYAEGWKSETKTRRRSVVDTTSVTFHAHFADTGAGAPFAVMQVDGGETYQMVKNEIIIGRKTKDYLVDVDLQNSKVSRRQAVVIYRDREFILRNEGRRPVFLNSEPIQTGHTAIVSDQSLISCSGSSMMFVVNPKLRKPEHRELQRQKQQQKQQQR